MDDQTHGGVAEELQAEADAALEGEAEELATPHDPVPLPADSTGSRHGSSVLPRSGEPVERPTLSGVPPVSDQPGMGRAAQPPDVEAGSGSLSSARIRSRQDRQAARRRRLAA